MSETKVYLDWKDKVVYPVEGAQPQVLAESEKFKAVVAGLAAGQKIPVHPEGEGIYIFLEGSGTMSVNEQQIPVAQGVTVITATGAKRGIEAHTQLSFIAVRIS
jgi:quercetin dioxygenase-like cupin family protein